MRRTMRRMAKQQSKSLAQAGGRASAVLVAAGKAGKQAAAAAAAAAAAHANGGMAGQSPIGSSDVFSNSLNGLAPKQASVFKDCYSSLLKQAEGDSMGGGSSKKPNSKRKRKDLRICTGAGGAASEGGMFLPDTPRRILHTQLLLQLLNNSSDDAAHMGKLDTVFFTRVSGANSTKNKKRNVGIKKGAPMALKGLPPLNGDAVGDAAQGHAFSDMDASFHSFEHLDMDFNEVSGVTASALP